MTNRHNKGKQTWTRKAQRAAPALAPRRSGTALRGGARRRGERQLHSGLAERIGLGAHDDVEKGPVHICQDQARVQQQHVGRLALLGAHGGERRPWAPASPLALPPRRHS